MTLSQMAVDILTTSDPHQKVLKSHEYSEKWFNSKVKNEILKLEVPSHQSNLHDQ